MKSILSLFLLSGLPMHFFSQPYGNEIVWELVVSGGGHVADADAGRCGGSLEVDVSFP